MFSSLVNIVSNRSGVSLSLMIICCGHAVPTKSSRRRWYAGRKWAQCCVAASAGWVSVVSSGLGWNDSVGDVGPGLLASPILFARLPYRAVVCLFRMFWGRVLISIRMF